MELNTTKGALKFLRLDKRTAWNKQYEIDRSILPHLSMEGQLMDMMEGCEHFKPFFNDSNIGDELNFNDNRVVTGDVYSDRWAELLFDLMVNNRLPTYPKPFQVNRNNRMMNGEAVEYRDPRDVADGLPPSEVRRWKTDGAIANIIGEVPFFTDPREWLYLRKTNYGDMKLNFDQTFRHMLENGVWVLPEFDAHYDIWRDDERFVGPIFNDVGPFPQEVKLIENDVEVVRNVEVVFIQGWVKVPYVCNATHTKRDGYDFKLEKLDEKILAISEMVAVDYDTGEFLGFMDDIMRYSSGQAAYVKFQDHPYGFPFTFLASNYYENKTPDIHFNRRMSGNYWGFPHFGYKRLTAPDMAWGLSQSLREDFHYEFNGPRPLIGRGNGVGNLMFGEWHTLGAVGNTFPHYLSLPNGARNDNEVIQTYDYTPIIQPDDITISGEVIPEYRPEGEVTENFKYAKGEMLFWEGYVTVSVEYDGTMDISNTYHLTQGLKNPSSIINRMHPALHSNKYNPYRFMDDYQGSKIDNYVPSSVDIPKYNQWRIDSMDYIYPSGSGQNLPLARLIPLPNDVHKTRLTGSYVHVMVHATAYSGEFALTELHFNEAHPSPLLPITFFGTESEVMHHAPFPDNYNYNIESEVFDMFNPRVATRGITLYHLDKYETQKLFLSFWEMTWDDWKDFFLSKSTDGILGLKWFYGFHGGNVTEISQEGGFTGIPEPIRIGNKTLTHKPITLSSNVHPMGRVLDFEFVQMEFNPFTVPIAHENSAGGSPHTTMDLYLPFYGYYKLDVDSTAGETLFVKYVISLFTGIASIRIYQVDSGFEGGDETSLRDHALIDVLQAEMSVDIPIDAQANETFMMKVANSIVQAPSNLAGPSGMIKTTHEALTTPSRTNVTRSGGLSSEFSIMAPLELRLLITTPRVVQANYNKGMPQYINGSLSGYNDGDFVKFDSFMDFPTSGEHKYADEIIELLKGGVYV